VNTISQKPIKGIFPIFVTGVFAFVDMLVSFWYQRSKIKVTASNCHNVPDKYNIFVIISANFAKIRSRMYLGLGHAD